MKVYILRNKEQIIEEMSERQALSFCAENLMHIFRVDCSFAWSDGNWMRQCVDSLYIIAASRDEVRDFILRGYYRANEFDGERGVIFRNIEEMFASSSV
jgi:hypothetical protein